VSKFPGKFRKNQDYNDDYEYEPKKKHKKEHAEVRRLKSLYYEDILSEYDKKNIPKKYKYYS
jgi:hypothetical protein